MKYKILYIALFTQLTLGAQTNLIINSSLEDWDNQMPEHWLIEKNTVDIYKSDFKLIPFGVKTTDLKFRSKFPISGSHGLAYFGLAGNESISCALKNPLKFDKVYELSFYVYNPPIYTDRNTNKFTVRFETDKGISKPLLIKSSEEIDTFSRQWIRVSRLIKGISNEERLHIGFFGDHYKDHPHNHNGLYYLFDQINLIELCPVIDTVNVHFNKGSHEINDNSLSEYLLTEENTKYNIKAKILGYASEEGDTKFNYQLSQLRCNQVQEKLIESLHIKIDTVIPFGEERQVSKIFEHNRVVQVIFQYDQSCTESIASGVVKNNKFLIEELKKMEFTDQKIRMEYDSLFNIQNRDSSALEIIEIKMRHIDSLNQYKLTKILDSIGYPGLSKVGVDYMDVPFIILQHANLKLRLKYEILLLNAVSEGEATKTWIPFMLDRNLVDQDKPQIYGTQLFWDNVVNKYVPFEIQNKKEVDELRSQFRLGSLKKYLNYVNEN